MKYDKERQCVVNDDGSRIESSWVRVGGTVSCSLIAWPKARYIKWLRDGLKDAGSEIVDNSGQWVGDAAQPVKYR